ncbi:hypothetical protein AAF712_012939 [Marasmius tenuissimus]|uniref:Uncharacterized protein n=1 Tax=Marasmius tenuissimus TaxID=585030 RepID=A0ABR2ZF66_9AGAR
MSAHQSSYTVNTLKPVTEASALALVGPLSAGPPAANVPFDAGILSAPVEIIDEKALIGPFNTSTDITEYVQSYFPDGATVEDVIRHGFIVNERLATQVEELEMGLTVRDRAIGQLFEMVKESHGTIKSLEGSLQASNELKSEIYRRAENLRQSFIRVQDLAIELRDLAHSRESNIAVLSAELERALTTIDQGQRVLQDAWGAFLFVAERCLHYKHSNVSDANEYVFDVLELATDAMGEAADDLRDRKLRIPESLGLAFEWLEELKRFLNRVTSVSKEIVGPADQVEEIIGEYVPQLQVMKLRDRLIKDKSLPKVPIQPYLQPSYYYNGGRPMIVVSSDEEEMDADEFQYPSTQVSDEA